MNFGSGDVVDVEGVGRNVDGGRYGVVVCGSDGSVNEGVLGVENRDGSRGSKDKINSGLGVSEAFVFRSGPLAGVGMLYTKKVTKVRRVVSVGGEKLVVKPGPGFRVFDVVTAPHGTSPLTFTLCTMHWRICILRVTFDLLLLFLSLLLLLSFSFRHRQQKQSSKAEQNFPHGHCILVNSSGQIQVKTAPVLLQPNLLKLHCSDFFLHALFVFAVCSLFLFP